MREIRLHGSEGGGPEPNRASLPLSGRWAFPDVQGTRDGMDTRSPPASAGGFESARCPTTPSPGRKPGDSCDRECIEPAGWKSLSGPGLVPVIDRNCVPVRGGGEHRKVNNQSVG